MTQKKHCSITTPPSQRISCEVPKIMRDSPYKSRFCGSTVRLHVQVMGESI